MSRFGLASLVVHLAVVAAVLVADHVIRRAPVSEVETPAQVDIVIGEGGESDQPARTAPGEAAASPAEPPPAPPQPEVARSTEAAPSEAAEDPAAAPAPMPASAPRDPEPAAPKAPASTAGAATVQLDDGGGRPYADLLDPENTRFRAARQDSGNRPPPYPRDAAISLEAGTVRLQLFVDAAGSVTNVLVVRSSGSPRLDRAAREQLRTWRFAPARRDGHPVPDIVEIDIEFRLM